jgi:hypothetical protein
MYQRLVREFGTVEVSSSVLNRLSFDVWIDKSQWGLEIEMSPDLMQAAEEVGFEVLPRKAVVMKLAREKGRYVLKWVGIASPGSYPVTVTTA